MPSPFPGMDPYLEDPGLWPDVHHWLISGCTELLNQQLRPKYYARIEERVYISDESDPARRVIIPDLRVVSRGARLSGGPSAVRGANDSVAEARIEVIDRLDRTVVAVIEILSPTNKILGSRGQIGRA